MRVLADENVYVAVVDALRGRGHDVEHVLRTTPSVDDENVLVRASGRVLLTSDRDFGALVYGRGLRPVPLGVLYLRTGTARPAAVATRIVSVVERAAIQVEGHFTVVSMDAVRQRPLPSR